MRIMGKRTIGELQASDFVITLMISDLASVPMQEIGIPMTTGIIPIAILVVMEIAASNLMLRSPRFAQLMSGRPVVVVSRGSIKQKALHDLRMTNEDLFEALRKQSIFDIETVSCAVVETDGTLSVLQKAQALPPSAEQMGVSVADEQISALLVSDGTIERNSLHIVGWSEAQVRSVLSREKKRIEDVFIMTGSADGSYNIIKKEQEGGSK